MNSPEKHHQARYFALIPAAGVGSRLGAATPKQYLPIGGVPVLRHTVAAFLNAPQIVHTAVVVSAQDGYVDDALHAAANLSVLRCGGDTRKESVRNGLGALRSLPGLDAPIADDDWVLVHDAARPGVTPDLIARLIERVAGHAVGGLLALPVVDTVKRVEGGTVKTIPRDGLWLAQTPQMFRYRLLCDALDAASEVTDEASAIEAAGYSPLLIDGHARNLKITLPSDLALAQLYLSGQVGD
ncbi:2-C-methyl-D-erythritol 4-phosphate cytidylyltransferase [Undibacterium sp.]|jgi:2-C-methyl-D-erythritol 4-phosphate cytidylyltransferase|uniref:2-C-methyl-D-erythritol 4-phosphate cytidylyltransferase n=1 Tax=Undibacterium sp. TaxID=1914977 RepID=UPI002B878828|nr:2-C-methyl-D-erythritol 4-phosphate cytidylyltransferase [Undibacterium sp.]HTD02878.1 2-C-methyl-D-erythritol 4-phosphate cytidylyltransferase [Undibacterium sp.]